jgi:hypothetical protein
MPQKQFLSRAEALDKVGIAIEIGVLGQPVERTSCRSHRRNGRLFRIDAFNHDTQPLTQRYAPPPQLIGHLAGLDVVQNSVSRG